MECFMTVSAPEVFMPDNPRASVADVFFRNDRRELVDDMMIT